MLGLLKSQSGKVIELNWKWLWGADALLEVLAQGGDYITIRMGDEPVIDKSPNTFTLEFDREEAGGGYYKIKDHFLEFEIWLCHVTKFVFGYLPKKIYCKY